MDSSKTLFYDNVDIGPSEDDPSLVEIDRIYALDFDRLSTTDGQALIALYERLPGAYRAAEIAFWFGDSAAEPQYLCASAEPSGLQVTGLLPESEWLAWHSAFIAGLEQYPFPQRDYD